METYSVKQSPETLFADVLRGMARTPRKHRMPVVCVAQLAQRLGLSAPIARRCAAYEARFTRAGSEAETWLNRISLETNY